MTRHPTIRRGTQKWRAALLSLIFFTQPAHAEMRPTLNLSGATGLIDMPSGEQQPDGFLTLDYSQFGPIFRNTLSFQIAPRLSGSFRYLGIHKWNRLFCPPRCSDVNFFTTYFDRSFDLRYQILRESNYLPAVTIGLQDFIGTGLSASEYIAATKSFGPRLKATAGLGFGRLGSFGSIGAPLGDRPPVQIGQGGNFNYKQWFRGDAALFGGVEYQVNDKLSLKAEYSSDAYPEEAARRGTFNRQSPFNFGLEYQYRPMIRLGAYSLYGSELGFNVSIALNAPQRPRGGIGGSGPEPVKPRPDRVVSPDAWSTGWLAQPDGKDILIGNLTRNLDRTGIFVESLGVAGDTAQVRFRNTKYDAEAQAVGRVARAMTQTMPASVETFELIPLVNGLPTAKVTVKRSDLEALEFAPDAGALLRARTAIGVAGAPLADFERNADLYPRLTWSVSPSFRTMLFDPNSPVQANVYMKFRASYEVRPGFILSGDVTKKVLGKNSATRLSGDSSLPPVRSQTNLYDAKADPDLETLTAAWYGSLGTDLYGRVTVGYLERMFGGISGEVLWKPVTRRWALGAELNYVAQRDPDGGLGFGYYDYSVTTGHLSGYFDFGKGYDLQLDVGRYLAGDVGGTITLMREFQNGWKIGAFATLTNVSAKAFGEGSFDKGIRLDIPIAWFSGQPSRTITPVVLRPLTRDGGARLEVSDRLYDTLHGYDRAGIDAQWGRFWK